MKCVHIVSRSSIRALEGAAGIPVDPLRFRPNLIIDGAEPWAEFDWIGKTLTIGDVRLSVVKRTVRCDAIDVDPTTAQRTMALPAVLQRNFEHTDFGIYARIDTPGQLTAGASIQVS
jgi:uncharacterized protein